MTEEPKQAQPAEPPAVRERADGWIPVDERQPDSDRLIWVMEASK